MHYLVAVGSVAAREHAGLAERFKLPATNCNTSVFLTSVKTLLTAAQSQCELLFKEGMAPALLDDIGRVVQDFEAVCEAQRTARRDHIGATADLRVIVARLAQQIKVLDGITRYRFGDDPEVMAEWKAARQVLGEPRRGGAPLTVEPGEVRQAA